MPVYDDMGLSIMLQCILNRFMSKYTGYHFECVQFDFPGITTAVTTCWKFTVIKEIVCC